MIFIVALLVSGDEDDPMSSFAFCIEGHPRHRGATHPLVQREKCKFAKKALPIGEMAALCPLPRLACEPSALFRVIAGTEGCPWKSSVLPMKT